MNLRDIVHHDVHTRQLGPDLGKETDVSTIDHTRAEKLGVRDILGFALNLDPLLDLGKLASDPWTVGIASAMDVSEDLLALLPAIFGSQPTRRLWEHEHAKE